MNLKLMHQLSAGALIHPVPLKCLEVSDRCFRRSNSLAPRSWIPSCSGRKAPIAQLAWVKLDTEARVTESDEALDLDSELSIKIKPRFLQNQW